VAALTSKGRLPGVSAGQAARLVAAVRPFFCDNGGKDEREVMGDENFGAELRRLRTEAGWSLTALSNRIHYTKGYLSKVENGVAPPNATLAGLCDAELNTGGVLIALVPHRRRKIRSRTFTVRPAGLPPATPFFTGRDDELDQIVALLRDTRARSAGVCALDGMAGSGKTALAVRAARQVEDEFPDGLLFLDLHAYTQGAREVDSAAALDRFLRQLGVPDEEIPRSEEDRAILYRGCLHDRRVLVVVDNVRSTHQVLPLLPGAPGCRMLVTSRNRLIALDDAHHVSLGPLTGTEATALFSSIAGRGRTPDDSDGRQVLTRVVERCGRLPLAVRIAAARYQGNPAWTLADLDERLSDRESLFAELDDGERSVYSAFQLSYDELPEEQRLMLMLLARYPGTDVDAHTVAAMADIPVPRARTSLDRLQTAHLLTPRPGGRFHCHDLLRAFARDVGERDLTTDQRRHATLTLLDYALHATERADVLVAPDRFRPVTTYEHLPPGPRTFADLPAALSWLGAEWPALVALVRVAAEHELHDRAWRLAFLLRGYFFHTKLWDAWIETHEVALASARAVGDRWAVAVTTNNLGVANIDRGEFGTAVGLYETALVLFRELRDEHGEVNALGNLGWVHHYQGEHEAAVRELSAALAFYRRTGNDRNAAITLRGIALAETALGHYADSIAHGEEALAFFEQRDALLDTVMALNCLGWTYFRSGRHDKATASYQRAAEIGVQADSPHETARAIMGLGNIAAAADDLPEARRQWADAERRYPDLNVTTVAESMAHRTAQH
jgi:tetratricopeptide (TPR) repeat protein/transcriptional regulator with XRE-family HTH domain